jgi:hypothetical protein
MKRLALFSLLALVFAGPSLTTLRVAPVDAVTIGPREGWGPEASRTLAAAADPIATRLVRGLPMATIPRAKESAREARDRAIAESLRPAGLPAGWHPPAPLVEAMTRWEPVEADERDYGTVYVQAAWLDLSAARRDRLVEAYEREVAGHRLAQLAGALGFVLACLAALVGYIRADEATRGYYTNQLRLAAVAAVGASGFVLYRALG